MVGRVGREVPLDRAVPRARPCYRRVIMGEEGVFDE